MLTDQIIKKFYDDAAASFDERKLIFKLTVIQLLAPEYKADADAKIMSNSAKYNDIVSSYDK